MTTPTLYHNPNCSKCREALALLRAQGIDPHVIAYLDQPPTTAELATLLQRLGMNDARQLMRKGEAEYTELGLDDPALSQDALLAAMTQHPRLIERPVLVNGERAIIGRPPERVLSIL